MGINRVEIEPRKEAAERRRAQKHIEDARGREKELGETAQEWEVDEGQ